MGNFLLQRGLLIYVLTPRSCDLYMIFYVIYEFVCLYLFGRSNRSHDRDICNWWSQSGQVYIGLGLWGPITLKGLSLEINKLEISFNCLFLSGWGVMIKGVIHKRGVAAEWGGDWWAVLGFRVLRADDVMLVVEKEIMWWRVLRGWWVIPVI